jgi:hypothetical protein
MNGLSRDQWPCSTNSVLERKQIVIIFKFEKYILTPKVLDQG